jgi:preprotein translocase subunit SecF
MTTTATPPPPPPDESLAEDVPGVTRRHKFADFYHERTNFKFMAHSRRYAIISGAFMVLSVIFVIVRGLNFGIEFEGGTEWRAEMQDSKAASVADVRDVLRPLGFDDAKVSILSSQSGDPTVRVQATVVEDPTRTIAKELAAYGKVTQADVAFTQTGAAGGQFTFTAADDVKPTQEAVEAVIKDSGMEKPVVKVDGSNVTVTTAKMPAGGVQDVANALAKYSGQDVKDVSITTVGPTWGDELSRKALQALIVFFLLLAIYLSIRFEWKMALSSIAAVIHDIIFTIGVYALFQFSVTPATVTAFLTILGFSLYDTVVVFDKIGEFQKTLTATGRMTYSDMVDKALNAVLMRSLSTTIVALLPVASLLIVGSLILGATALEDFAIALAVGLAIGAYSSIFVAAPLLAWWKEQEPQYKALKDRKRRTSLAAAVVSTGAPIVSSEDYGGDPVAAPTAGIPGPPAVPRATIQAKPRQQRGRKRK